ncbi:hypothetical protein C1646_752871 [Rhizophagus diaphanus]|nr:hypothetical protein C1646_752871 [Rhizophagus diaphanus] [Rhizophagus sp. MUCL 43196]
MLNGLILLCKTHYQFSRKIAVKYTVEWTDENDQVNSRYSLSSAGAARSLFLKKIIATIESIILKIDGEIVELHFDSGDTTADNIQHLDSIVHTCDEILISRDALVPIKTFNIDSSTTFDDIVVPILIKSESPVLKVGDKINIKLSGDERNVGRKQKYVMLTMCILNEVEAVLNPHQYSQISHEQLKEGYRASDGTIWPIELFFSSDWKFVTLVLGINVATSNYFCLYCNCHKDERHNMIKYGCKNPMLFCEINQNNWIPDELHLMLRISDVLFQCLFHELVKQKEFTNKTQVLIIEEMKKLHVHFEFYLHPQKMENGIGTSLMGPDKKKILKDFQVANLFEGQDAAKGQNIEKL